MALPDEPIGWQVGGPDPVDAGPTERELTDWNEANDHADDAPGPDEDDGGPDPDPTLPPPLKIPVHKQANGTGCPWSNMDSTSGVCPEGCLDGRHPDARYAVVVTRPDGEVFRFGPARSGTTASWAASLRLQLTGSAPQGTTVEVEPYRPLPPTGHTYIDPDTIPSCVDELIEPLRADPGHPANGGFPDLYARLLMKHGHNRGDRMWMDACNQIDAYAEYEQAQANVEAGAVASAALIREAIAAATAASAKLARVSAEAADFELSIPGDPFPSDATVHLDDALRSLRAAERVVRPTKED